MSDEKNAGGGGGARHPSAWHTFTSGTGATDHRAFGPGGGGTLGPPRARPGPGRTEGRPPMPVDADCRRIEYVGLDALPHPLDLAAVPPEDRVAFTLGLPTPGRESEGRRPVAVELVYLDNCTKTIVTRRDTMEARELSAVESLRWQAMASLGAQPRPPDAADLPDRADLLAAMLAEDNRFIETVEPPLELLGSLARIADRFRTDPHFEPERDLATARRVGEELEVASAKGFRSVDLLHRHFTMDEHAAIMLANTIGLLRMQMVAVAEHHARPEGFARLMDQIGGFREYECPQAMLLLAVRRVRADVAAKLAEDARPDMKNGGKQPATALSAGVPALAVAYGLAKAGKPLRSRASIT